MGYLRRSSHKFSRMLHPIDIGTTVRSSTKRAAFIDSFETRRMHLSRSWNGGEIICTSGFSCLSVAWIHLECRPNDERRLKSRLNRLFLKTGTRHSLTSSLWKTRCREKLVSGIPAPFTPAIWGILPRRKIRPCRGHAITADALVRVKEKLQVMALRACSILPSVLPDSRVHLKVKLIGGAFYRPLGQRDLGLKAGRVLTNRLRLRRLSPVQPTRFMAVLWGGLRPFGWLRNWAVVRSFKDRD